MYISYASISTKINYAYDDIWLNYDVVEMGQVIFLLLKRYMKSRDDFDRFSRYSMHVAKISTETFNQLLMLAGLVSKNGSKKRIRWMFSSWFAIVQHTKRTFFFSFLFSGSEFLDMDERCVDALERLSYI